MPSASLPWARPKVTQSPQQVSPKCVGSLHIGCHCGILLIPICCHPLYQESILCVHDVCCEDWKLYYLIRIRNGWYMVIHPTIELRNVFLSHNTFFRCGDSQHNLLRRLGLAQGSEAEAIGTSSNNYYRWLLMSIWTIANVFVWPVSLRQSLYDNFNQKD